VVVALAALGGVVLLAAFRRQRQFAAAAWPAATAAAALLCLWSEGPTAVWRHSGLGAGRAQLPPATPNALRDWQHKFRRMTVWEADGTESSVALVAGNSYSFYVNGKSDGNARQDANTQVMLGMLGAILHPEAKHAAVVGLGSGESAGWLAATPGMERVDVIELEPAMDEVARRCGPLNHHVFQLPNVRRILNDAREVLLTTPDRYDLIVSEPSNPYRAGIASLYTREFYAAVRQRLNQDGLFVQWLQAYEVDGKTVRTVLATLHDAFPHVEIWRSAGTDMLLVCSAKTLVHHVELLRQRAAEPHVQSALRLAWHTDSLEGVFGFFVANSRFVAEVSQHEPQRNTDDHNVLEYGFARSVGRAHGFSVESLLAEAFRRGMQLPEVVSGSIDWDRADAERRACLLLSNENVLSAAVPPQTDGQRKRSEPIDLVAAGDPRGALERWSQMPPESLSASEVLLFAAAGADLADESAPKLIERVRSFHPLEADALDAVLLQRQGKFRDAAQKLRGLFIALRDDPTPDMFAIRPCFRLAVEVAHAEPLSSPLLFDALGKPFSVMLAEEMRLAALADLAPLLKPEIAVRALEVLEPHVPWTEEFLNVRAHLYRAAGHPLALQAEHDLAAYVAQAADDEVLPDRSHDRF
jgi:spermidine synthase